ncbi:copper homeostasis membrane protein CopD [Mesorhizobium sp. B4-1-3]|uniref:copper homeostasis membrane protein CopD n=1 Tax=Mesorhizobium sp. B4-1-3 TaxID=2589889 RepID=UPI001129F03D|nr:copper homeostasis membrane protein CopD [Mesorhizobium sp. B4-1-3]TPI13007.1 copper homeostasis membrane protein CopD [Mesorhizobium sp. B4-1-3]
MSPDTLLAACRFLHDGALMALWGCFGYLATLVPEGLAKEVSDKLAASRLAAAGLAAVTTLLALPLQAAIIGEGWPDAANGQMLMDVITSTSVGKAWLAQLAGVVVVVIAQFLAVRHRLAATAATSGLALATLALSGHAVMQEGWQGVAHPLNDMLHVLAAGAWFGALLPLLLVLSAFGQPPSRAEASVALRRFSTAGHWAVALAILSGVANSFFIVGWPPLGWGSTYRVLLTAKIAVVSVMTALAILNRYWFVPRIRRDWAAAVAAIRTGTLAEIGLGLTAILLVSIFGMLDPAGLQ